MNRRIFMALALGLPYLLLNLGTLCAEQPFRYPEGKHGRGELRYHDGVPVMVLEGTPAEMAQQQAALVGPTIKPLLDYPRKFVAEGGYDFAWPFMTSMGRELMKHAVPRYQQELNALVEAGDLEADAVIVANTMLELRRMGGCSALMLEDPHTTIDGPLFGRLFDFPTMGLLDRYSIVTVYRPKGQRAFVSVGWPGVVGVVSGINDAGLALATLDVYASNDKSPKFDWQGVPMTLTFRRILEECSTVAEAEKLLREARLTTWMNLAVCDRQTAAVFELTPDRVEVRRPNRYVLCCTNHFCTEVLSTGIESQRFETLSTSRKQKPMSVADVAAKLHAVNQGELTLQAMIFEPRALQLHIGFGKPPVTARPLTTLDLKPWLTQNSSEPRR